MIPPTFQPSTKRAHLLYQVLRLGELKSRSEIANAIGGMYVNNAASELRKETKPFGYNVVHSMVGRLHCYKLVRDSSTEEARTRSGVVSVPQSTERAGGHGGQMPQSDGLAGGDHGSPGTNKSVGGCCQLAAPPANPSDVTSEPTVPISLNPTSEIARPPGEMGRSAERLHADTFEQLELVA